MNMNRAYQITGVVFLLLAAFIARESLELKFYTSNGPGPGFFPFWLSMALGLLAVLMILKATFRESEPIPEGFFASRAHAGRQVAAAGAPPAPRPATSACPA